MEDHSQSFSALHHHRHRPSFPLTLPSFQSSEVGYPSPQPAQESLVQYGSRGEAPTTSFLISNTSPGVRRGSCGGDRVFLNSGAGSLDGDASLGGHLDGDGRMGGHFDSSWYGGGKKEVWDDGESCESAGDCYGGANDLYMMDCEDGARRRVRANCNNYVSCEVKAEPVHSREADVGHFAKQTAAYDRGGGAGSFNNSAVDYCRSESRVSDSYLEDYGSSCGSGEDQLQPAEVEGPWLSISPSSQGEGRWRGAADGHALAPGCPPQRSPIGRMYTQKLDSFSEAFLSQRKRRFPMMPTSDSWDFGSAGLKSRQTCVFDPDSYLPPPSSSSSSSPAHPSLPSFPSPPTSSHLMPSVLSPPPTPLPPPSHSPSNKMDSPGGFAGVPGHSVPQGGESLGALQFFTSRLQPVPAVHSSGMLWKFPLLSHCFPQSAGDPGNAECNLRASHEDEYGSSTATHDILQSPESIFLSSSSHRPSLTPSRVLCPSTSPSLHTSFHLSSAPSLLSGQHLEAAEKIAPPCVVTQKVKNGPASLNQSHLKQQATPVHTGTPFPSTLRSRRGQKRGRYTPRPLLNPHRRGTGLYSNLLSLYHREEGGDEEEECAVLPCVNVGPDFQAELPPCFGQWSEVWSPEDESPREQLLWKPCDEQEESAIIQDQVEKLLSMCSSSCLPGGGSNTELALHCLHYCQGNTMATLEMLLFSDPSPAGDYHYSGCGSWTDAEKNLFNAALATNGKDFSVIHKMVRTKTVCQCVEFYYLSKKLLDKQKKQREEENRVGELEQQKSVTPICQPVDRQFALEEAVPVPSLASFFPCKLCGKMFYKIKSRNAHMKIHRQPQEDWTERRLQHQLLTQRLALSHPTNLIPTPGSNLLPPQTPAATFSSSADNVHSSVNNSDTSVLDPSTVVSYTNAAPPNSHVIANIDAGDSHQRQQPTPVLPFHQSWGSFGHPPDPATFYCSPEEKGDVGAGTVGVKEPINWQ